MTLSTPAHRPLMLPLLRARRHRRDAGTRLMTRHVVTGTDDLALQRLRRAVDEAAQRGGGLLLIDVCALDGASETLWALIIAGARRVGAAGGCADVVGAPRDVHRRLRRAGVPCCATWVVRGPAQPEPARVLQLVRG